MGLRNAVVVAPREDVLGTKRRPPAASKRDASESERRSEISFVSASQKKTRHAWIIIFGRGIIYRSSRVAHWALVAQAGLNYLLPIAQENYVYHQGEKSLCCSGQCSSTANHKKRGVGFEDAMEV